MGCFDAHGPRGLQTLVDKQHRICSKRSFKKICLRLSSAASSATMKSIFHSRFFILLPWILIVIIVIDSDTKRSSVRNTASFYLSRLGNVQQQRQDACATRTSSSGGSSSSISTGSNSTSLPVIYAITPTYSRTVQKAELTRLANTFRQIPQFHWIVVEDSNFHTKLVSRFLARSGLRYTHLTVLTPRRYKQKWMPRATEQRNAALGWLREHRTSKDKGVVFFADDDNTYSLDLFEEMRSAKRVAVWPVGLVGGWKYGRPLVENGKVVGWYTGWGADRPFAIDMAGFAVNLQVILSKPQALFKRKGAKPGMQETDFLEQITTIEDLEPKAQNCTQVLVWHTRTEKVVLGNKPTGQQDSVFIEI